MIELRTLGTLDLRGTGGHELRRILQQPKRLALLAYLAVASPRRFHRRDALLALFWPELDSEHARGALRRSLHFLRHIVGEQVIVGRGDEEIGLASGALWCDTTAFEELLAANQIEGAIALYRGELLQGFYISDAPDFERWLDRERARLRELAAASGWTLAERLASSKPHEAARLARWVAALEPHDDATARRLVALLAATGDRAGAVRAFDEFARRLRADFDVEPSREATALVATIRADGGATAVESNGRATPARIEAARPASPHVLAVLPFTVRGSRELAYLEEGMVDLLSTTLDGAGELRTVDPRALLAHLAREKHAVFDLDRARVVARAFGAGRFLLGSVVHAGGRIRISATLYDASAAPCARAEVAGSSEAGIFDMVDDLARGLLGEQGTGPGARFTKLAARTTTSLPALKAYLRGECELRAGRYFQSLESFQNAVSEDDGFALAHYRLSSAAAATADPELAREASAQAMRGRGRLGRHDRVLVEAQQAWLRGAADEAERLYAAALATHPDDVEAWFLLGDVLFHHNPRRGRSMAESREPFERAMRYDPDNVFALVHLARLAAFERQPAELDALVERVLRLSPAGDRALSVRALRAFAVGNELEKARTVAALGRARALAVGIAFTDIVLYAHDLAGSHRLARIVTKLTRAPEAKALCHIVLALLDQTRGRQARAAVELTRAAALDVSWALELRALFTLLPFRVTPRSELLGIRDALVRWNAGDAPPNRNQVLASHNGIHPLLRLYLLGATHVRLGDTEDAMTMANALEGARDDGHVQGFGAHLGRCVRAQIAHAAGRPAEALEIVGDAQPEVWYQLTVTSPFYSGAHDRYLRAEALFELGRDEEALGWYGALGEGSPYELIYLAPALLRQAQIHERLGRRDRAASARARATRLWEGCDVDLCSLLETVPA
jgi:DNA-binding SARP family transcriptional activator